MVGRPHRPTVTIDIATSRTASDYRLDGEHQSRTKPHSLSKVGVICYVRKLMDRAADTVAAVLGQDAESVTTDFALHCAANLENTRTGFRGVHCRLEGTLRTICQCRGGLAYCAYSNRDCGVGIIAVFLGRHVELHQVAFHQRAASRYSVNRFIVHANAAGARKVVNLAGGRRGAMLGQDTLADRIEFSSRDARFRRSCHCVECLSYDHSNDA